MREGSYALSTLSRYPKTLLLTLGAPDARYKVMRKIVDELPPDSVCWCSLLPCRPESLCAFQHRDFSPRRLHWRLNKGALGYLYSYEWQAKRIARKIADWCSFFQPTVLWVLSDPGAAAVAVHLRRMLGLPMHATVHDLPETALSFVPRLYLPFFNRSVERLLRCAGSVDVISGEMLSRVKERYRNVGAENSMVFHPSILSDWVSERSPDAWAGAGNKVRRIGFCGSMRVSARQWGAFLELLGSLPFEFEMTMFAYDDLFHNVGAPGNVALRFRPYAGGERDVIEEFRGSGVHACHLGLWKEKERSLFVRTSLSAKLTTYAAAGVPVIVDAPEDSAAWRLVKAYGAGVLCGEKKQDDARELTTLFGDHDVWQRMAKGARELCLREFNMDKNIAAFKELLCRTADSKTYGIRAV